jgi:hypothetical protein
VAVFCLLLTVGCVISPRRTLGGGGGTPTPTPTPTGSPTPTPVATGKLYVMDTNSNTLLRFDNAFTASGNATPAATIVGTNTTFSSPAFITLDVANDSLYIADTGDLSVVIYDGISTKNSGNVAPSRIIAGVATNLLSPTDVSLDKTRNLLYVADDVDIHVFASATTANGNQAPARDLSVPFAVSAIFIDGTNDRLYVADQAGNAIAVYDHASTLNGPITANRAVQGATNTHLSNPGGVQVDGAGRLVVSNASPPSITIYANAATADGDVAPVATISGASTGLSVPDQIVVDTTGTGTLYNADPGAARVAVWSNLNTANGNISPTRTISGANTGMTAGGPVGVAFDNTR